MNRLWISITIAIILLIAILMLRHRVGDNLDVAPDAREVIEKAKQR